MAGDGRNPRRGADENLSRVASKAGRLRLQRGLTQAELARRCGIGKRTVERYDQGAVKNPPIRQLLSLAQTLGCDLDDLIEDEWHPRRATK